ncbi:MAG: hypothetical protein LBO76_07740 [Treponema sp.]|jgi:hypothetical protein|nr:hypothetical protein [Treponema sp.]
MRKLKFGLTAVLVLCAVLLASCLDFFSNSLGENLARDPATIKVTPDNVDKLLKESKGDSAASRGILDKIAAELKNSSTPDPKLQAAAVTAANQAAGLGELVLGNIGTVLNTVDGSDTTTDGDTFATLLGEVQNQVKENEFAKVAASTSDSLGGALDPAATTPQFKGEALNNVSEADLTLLAFTLILAETEKISDRTFDDYIKTWTDGNKLNGTGLSDSERLIAAIGNKLANGDGKIGKTLGDLLGKKE